MMKKVTSRGLLFVLLCCLMCVAKQPDVDSLKGHKLVYNGSTDEYAYLKITNWREIPEFTVCIDLYRTIDSANWTVFSYDASETKGVDFVLAGTHNNLSLHHFGNYSSFGSDLPINIWHSVCCTWTGTEMDVFINGSLKFREHFPLRFLSGDGTLVLGFNHTNLGKTPNGSNNIYLHTSTVFRGSLYYFQMWNKTRLPNVLNYCSEGNVIRWDATFWKFHRTPPVEDQSLRCANYTIQSTSGPTATTVLQTTAGHISPSTRRTTADLYTSRPVDTTVNAGEPGTFTAGFLTSTSGLMPTATTQPVVDTNTTSKLTSTAQHTATPTPTLATQPNGATEPSSQTNVPFSSETSTKESQFTTKDPNTILTTPSTHVKETSPPSQSSTTPNTVVFTTLEANSNGTGWTSSPRVNTKPQTMFTSLATKSLPASLSTTEATTKVTFYTIKMTMTVESRDGLRPTRNILLYLTKRMLSDAFANTDMFVLQLTVSEDRESRIIQVSSIRNGLSKQSYQNFKSEKATSDVTWYDAKAILKTSSSDTQEQVISKIENTLQNRTFSHFRFMIHVEAVKVTYIAPGSCPTERTSSEDKGSYFWGVTQPNERAVQPCDKNAEEQATRKCSINIATDKVQWEPPTLKKCKLLGGLPDTIIDFRDVVITQENAPDVAEHILNLSIKMDILSKEEVEVILSKTYEIIQIGDIDESFASNLLSVISDVLDKAEQLRQFTNRILTLIEELGDKVTFDGQQMSITATGLAVAVTGVDLSLFSGIFFSVTSYFQGSEPEILMHDIPLNLEVDFMFLPGSMKHHIPDVSSKIQFNFFGTTSLFQDTEISRGSILNTYVIGASVTDRNIENLDDPVSVTLQHLKENKHDDPVHCVFWDFEKNNKTGGWSTEGCHLMFTNENYTKCNCTHLTHFGVLMDISGEKIDPQNNRILTIITYAGCGISSIFLGVALVTYLALVQLRKDNPSKILMNLCTALLMLNLLFLINNWVSSFKNYGLCISTAILLHYFLLVSFTWMGLEAVHMYFALVKVFNVYVRNYILKFCIVGWGVPAIIVSTVVIVNKDFYGIQNEVSKGVSASADDNVSFCWIEDPMVFYISVVSYFSIIFLMNVSMFIVVLHQINVMKSKQHTGVMSILHDLKSTASLTFLLGLTWGFAFFAWGPVRIVFLYLFAITNTLQGFFIFLFHCMLKENVRHQWRLHLCIGRFRLENTSDWSRLGDTGSKRNKIKQNHKSQSSQSMNFNSTLSLANGSRREMDDTFSKTLTSDWSALSNTGSMHKPLTWQQISAPESLKSCSSSSVSNGSGSFSDDNSTWNLTNGGKYDNLCCMPPIKCVTTKPNVRKLQLIPEIEVKRTKTFWDSK
ncbi:adhesion G-protein coupled receptor G4 isoform X2 [Pleurodeles waltl]|uniref:adhesion G-protein coupled receptor G4 isoform X2 n=1 Tax=Pleurodeles waltl TaxID=8319 RepID=UPI00370993F8